MSRISAVEKGRINKAKYLEYVNRLEETGSKFPLNNFGEVNLTAIASACGFNRQVFATNKSMKQQLKEDILRIGTDITPGEEKESRLQKKADKKSKEASRLQSELDARTAENESLRSQISELQKKIRELEAKESEIELSMNELLTSGRRFTI